MLKKKMILILLKISFVSYNVFFNELSGGDNNFGSGIKQVARAKITIDHCLVSGITKVIAAHKADTIKLCYGNQ